MTIGDYDRLEDLARAIRMLEKSASMSLAWANGSMGAFLPDLRKKWLRQHRLRMKGAVRLRKMAAKLCAEIQQKLLNGDHIERL